MSSLDTWLINGIYLMGIVVFVCMWLFYLRAHYSKAVVGRLLCEFITEEGNSYTQLLPVVDGKVTVKPKGKKNGRIYVIADIAAYTVDYPNVPRFLSMISTKVKKAIYDVNSWEPLTNRRNRLLLDPARLYNWDNQRFTHIGVDQAREESPLRRPRSGGSGINWTWVVIGAVVLAIVIGGYYIVQNIDSLKGATGIG